MDCIHFRKVAGVVGSGKICTEDSVYNCVIAHEAGRHEHWWVRAVSEMDAKGGSAKGFMSPVYALIWVDDALIGQPTVAMVTTEGPNM